MLPKHTDLKKDQKPPDIFPGIHLRDGTTNYEA